MKTYDPMTIARRAMPFHSGRPAMTLMHDSPDVRLIVFRIPVGQEVPLHTSSATVLLHVLSGCGQVSDAKGDHAVHAGTVVAYEPREIHGMRAISEELVLLAIIAPRPRSRETSSLSASKFASVAAGA
jgi:quercetin dioxygenase-like cupin family protein